MLQRKRRFAGARLTARSKAFSSDGRHYLRSQKIGAEAIGAQAIGSKAIGTLAIGAIAFGALAIGALAIGWLSIGRARVRRIEVGDLVIRRLRVTDALELPTQASAGLEPGNRSDGPSASKLR